MHKRTGPKKDINLKSTILRPEQSIFKQKRNKIGQTLSQKLWKKIEQRSWKNCAKNQEKNCGQKIEQNIVKIIWKKSCIKLCHYSIKSNTFLDAVIASQIFPHPSIWDPHTTPVPTFFSSRRGMFPIAQKRNLITLTIDFQKLHMNILCENPW